MFAELALYINDATLDPTSNIDSSMSIRRSSLAAQLAWWRAGMKRSSCSSRMRSLRWSSCSGVEVGGREDSSVQSSSLMARDGVTVRRRSGAGGIRVLRQCWGRLRSARVSGEARSRVWRSRVPRSAISSAGPGPLGPIRPSAGRLYLYPLAARQARPVFPV